MQWNPRKALVAGVVASGLVAGSSAALSALSVASLDPDVWGSIDCPECAGLSAEETNGGGAVDVWAIVDVPYVP